MLPEQTYIASNGTKVIYRHKKGKYDFNHTIFVFSGFLNAKPGNYDFANALNDCPCDVVWICDNFEDMYTYYLCVNMDFKVENAVTEFIHHKLKEFNISEQQCTVTGFSKGGSAALYYGLKLNIPNIVVSVPQMHIGSYVHNFWQHVATHMMGEKYGIASQNYLDKLLPRLLKQDKNLDRNIYLLTSDADKQFKPEIEPYLADFSKYKNFNLLKTHSAFVREHNQVTGHHTALLLSIFYALASEAVPRYSEGKVEFFGSQPYGNPQPSGEPYADLQTIRLENNRLFLDGIALLKGYDIPGYPDVNFVLILENENTKPTSTVELPLAKTHQPALTKRLFDGKYMTIYDKANFTTYKFEGIDISNIKQGIYKLSVEIKLSIGVTARTPLVSTKNLPECELDRYQIFKKDGIFYLKIA